MNSSHWVGAVFEPCKDMLIRIFVAILATVILGSLLVLATLVVSISASFDSLSDIVKITGRQRN